MSHKSSSAKIWRKFGKRYPLGEVAKLVTWSEVQAAPEGMEIYTPYIVAIVELADGTRMTTQLVDLTEAEKKKLKAGAKLRPVFRQYYKDGAEGLIHYGVKYKLG